MPASTAVAARTPLYKRERERFLFLFVTNACTLRCKHCFVGNERLNDAESMTVEQATEILDYFRAFGGHDKLYILGGEPTLHPQLPQIVAAARARGYSVTISSNGDFEDEVFDILPPDAIQSFNFSIDGPDAATHAKIRGRKTNFARVTSRVRAAVARGYQVRIMCTVTQANVDHAMGMIDVAAELGAHILSYHNLGLTGNAVTMQKPLNPNDWMRFCEAIEAHPPRRDLAVYYPPTFVPADSLPHYAERGYPGCPARSFDRVYVYPDGTVYNCPLLMDGGRFSTRFQDGRLQLQAKAGAEFDIFFKVAPICFGCPNNQTCGGGCPAWEAMPPHDSGRFACDRDTVPICMLWTTYAWDQPPQPHLHALR